jgi:DNA anti-recombination protein RmuC
MNQFHQIGTAIIGDGTNLLFFFVLISLASAALTGIFTDKWPRLSRFSRHSPAILVTIGIFGSFWGISIGLINFDAQDIQKTTPLLLDGLKVKFISSLMGVFFSIIVKLCQSFSNNRTSGTYHPPIPGNVVEVLAQIRDESRESAWQHAVLLETIKTSLVGDGESSIGTQLLKLRTTTADAFGDLNRNTLVLRTEFRTFAERMAENNSKALIEALKEVIHDFNEKIHEQFGDNFKQLNLAVAALLTWQENYKTHVERLTDQFNLALNGIEQTKNALNVILARSEKFAGVAETLGGLLGYLDKQIKDMTLHLQAFSDLANNAKDAFPIIRTNLEHLTTGFKDAVEDSVQHVNLAVKSLSEAVEKSAHDVVRITEHQEKTLVEASNRFNAIVDQSLNGLTRNLEGIVTGYAAKLNDLFNQFWDKSDSLLEAHDSAFDTILKNFNQLDTKARQHAEQVFRQANDHLRKLAEEAIRFLQSQTGDIHRIVEGARQEFHGAVSRMAKENGEVLSKQIAQLDRDLQEQLKKALENMGSHLASLSQKFVQDYTPLTNRLREVVRIADGITLPEKRRA